MKKGKFIGGVIATAIAACAVYFLTSKRTEKHRKELLVFINKMKAEIINKMKELSDITEEKYKEIVDEILKKYERVLKVSEDEFKEIVKELKDGWKHIKKSIIN